MVLHARRGQEGVLPRRVGRRRADDRGVGLAEALIGGGDIETGIHGTFPFLLRQWATAAFFGELKARSIAITTKGVTAAIYMLSTPNGLPSTYQIEVNTAAASRPSVAPRPLLNSGR